MDMTPVGSVSSPRTEPLDDDWAAVTAVVTLDDQQFTAQALSGLREFSHVEVVYLFDRVVPGTVHHGARHPRGNPAWPQVGIFAQRARDRPNRLGVSVCELLAVHALTLTCRGLDAIDGTPVLDIKPYMVEFAPRGTVRQPDWSHQLMAGYWGDNEPFHPDPRPLTDAEMAAAVPEPLYEPEEGRAFLA